MISLGPPLVHVHRSENYLQIFPEGFPNEAVTPFWSLAVEEQFYLVWPLVIFFLPVKRLPKVLCAALILIPVLRGIATPILARHGAQWAVYQGTIFRMDTLAAGALLTFAWRAHRERIRAYGHYGLIATASMLPIMLILSRFSSGFRILDHTARGNVVTFEVALFGMVGLVFWALSGNFTNVLRVPLLGWLARISYMFYLVHRGALDLVQRFISNKLVSALVALALPLIVAELSWRLLERPILHGGSRREKARELSAALEK